MSRDSAWPIARSIAGRPCLAIVLAVVVTACGGTPATTQPGRVGPTVQPVETDSTNGRPAGPLLATLPTEAGGLEFDGVQVVAESPYLVGHPVDGVLRALGKERGDAESVYRYSGQVNATLGATEVEGVDGDALLKAFAEAWDAPAVINRWTRVVGGSRAWELSLRGGSRTLVYRIGDVVYLVSAEDSATLEAILVDMPAPVP